MRFASRFTNFTGQADPRRPYQGCSRSALLQTLGNEGYAVCSAFPQGNLNFGHGLNNTTIGVSVKIEIHGDFGYLSLVSFRQGPYPAIEVRKRTDLCTLNL